jgi:hypothetical protein
VYEGPGFKLTDGVVVHRVEYISELATTYPVTVNTAFIVDLREFYHVNSTEEIPTVARLVRINVRQVLSLRRRPLMSVAGLMLLDRDNWRRKSYCTSCAIPWRNTALLQAHAYAVRWDRRN